MGALNSDPFGEERELYNFITQETRYLILQYILAHPENLPTLRELSHVIPRGQSTIREHLDTLIERGLVDEYKLDERPERDLPKTFFGLTEHGIDALDDVGMLRAMPALQVMYEQLEKPPLIERYETAPRPERMSHNKLRAKVERAAAAFDEDDLPDDAKIKTDRMAGAAKLLQTQE
jgi:predicted ArsR family transcriptional regulator